MGQAIPQGMIAWHLQQHPLCSLRINISFVIQGLWTHGGSVFGDYGWVQADDGTSLASDIFPGPNKCPAPICARSNPTDIHIYHYRSPSIEDDVKKSVDWRWKEHPEEELHVSDDDYAASTWFYNQMRDVSLFQFAEALQARMLPLLTPQSNTSMIMGTTTT